MRFSTTRVRTLRSTRVGWAPATKNFYNTILQKYGYVDEAIAIQDNYLAGDKDKAASLVPAQMLRDTNLVGTPGHVKERLAAYSEAGVTHLTVNAVGKDPVKTVEELKKPPAVGLRARPGTPVACTPDPSPSTGCLVGAARCA